LIDGYIHTPKGANIPIGFC